MKIYVTYCVIFVLLLMAELIYFKIADKFNIIDKPNERSSHSTIALRGGGVIFTIGAWIWFLVSCFSRFQVSGAIEYLPFMIGLTMVAGVSFVDDIHPLHDRVRLIVQFVAMALMFWNIGLFEQFQVSEGSIVSGIVLPALFVLIAFIVCVGATNIINFMDGINGITGAYAMASLIPLAVLNSGFQEVSGFRFQEVSGFVEPSLIYTVVIADIVFCIFNFRPKGKAKCFAGDVGSVGIGFILLFLIGKLIMNTGDVTYLLFLIIYGLDGVITICHRILLHENLGEAHRKHAFQLMANELKMSHVTVSLIYALTQLAINLVCIYLVPNNVAAHWIYLVSVLIVFGIAFLLFRKKYYHLHAEYLASLKK